MRFPRPKTVSFYHLGQDGDTQVYSDEADETATCGFLPMDRKDAALSGVDLTDPYELYCPAALDVRLSDRVEVAGQTSDFYVKHIFTADFGGLPHKRVTISRNA